MAIDVKEIVRGLFGKKQQISATTSQSIKGTVLTPEDILDLEAEKRAMEAYANGPDIAARRDAAPRLDQIKRDLAALQNRQPESETTQAQPRQVIESTATIKPRGEFSSATKELVKPK